MKHAPRGDHRVWEDDVKMWRELIPHPHRAKVIDEREGQSNQEIEAPTVPQHVSDMLTYDSESVISLYQVVQSKERASFCRWKLRQHPRLAVR